MTPCLHCTVPTSDVELTAGYCHLCATEEGPAGDDGGSEAAASSCVDAGLNVIPSPCDGTTTNGRTFQCTTCDPNRTQALAAPIEKRRRYRHGAFSDVDVEELKNHFSKPAPVVPGTSSGFGAMCSRIGKAVNQQTKERPNRTEPRCPICGDPLTQWHVCNSAARQVFLANPTSVRDIEVGGQLVQVSVYPGSGEPLAYDSQLLQSTGDHGAGRFGSWDEKAVDFVQARRRARHIHATLQRVGAWHTSVLEARYAAQEEQSASDERIRDLASVALMTTALQKLHDQRAHDGIVENSRETLHVLTQAATTAKERDWAVEHLRAIRAEAEQLVIAAQNAYAEAAREN